MNNFFLDSRDSRSNTESRKSSSEEISVQRGMSKEAEPEPPAANSSPKAEPRESPKAETDLAPAEDANRTENHDFNFNLEDFLQLDNLPLLTVSNHRSFLHKRFFGRNL